MTENATIQVQQDDSTENYAIYESADGDTIVGMYVEQGIAETLGEFAAVTILDAEDADDDATAGKKKDTTNYGVFELPPAVTGMYVSHDALDSEETEDGFEAPDSIGLELAPSDEETFEDSLPDAEEQADALVADEGEEDEEDEPSAEEQADALVAGTSSAGSEADSPSASENESESDDSDEEVEIADDEIGIDD